MKIENLGRANELALLKANTTRYIEANAKALDFISKYPNGYYPFNVDGSMATSGNYDTIGTNVLIKHILCGGDDTYITIPFSALNGIIKNEIQRLKNRLEEIDKEIASL